MRELTFGPMTRAAAAEIARWRYDPPYDVYDIPADEHVAAIEYMVDPSKRYFAGYHGDDLVGYVSVGEDGRVPGWTYNDQAVDVGAGMRPESTGHGHGATFLEHAFRFVDGLAGGMRLRTTIASWNTRALRAAEKNGFVATGTFHNPAGIAFTVLERRTS
jgi:[ribosomal protein S18]-alanine N-acetyltransferase